LDGIDYYWSKIAALEDKDRRAVLTQAWDWGGVFPGDHVLLLTDYAREHAAEYPERAEYLPMSKPHKD
jgi:hypothetical protein